jgi:EAL domain-containing protein (putative c-di-GMP-specific phosphodiesterase class I)
MHNENASATVGSLLIVDDSASQRAYAAALCRAKGIVIHEASGGTQALELLETLPQLPDLLIVDLEMPGMDGVELIQQLHQRRCLIPLIVASGRELPLIQSVEAMARALGMPVLAGIQKPLNAEALQSALLKFRQVTNALRPVPPRPSTAAISAVELAQAIQNGEITVHYQPKVDMPTAIVRGVEVLARWQRADNTFVRPDQFIELAEREELIFDLTCSVMRQALAQAAEWNARGLKLSLAINLSPRLLDYPDLVQHVSCVVEEYGLKPDQIVLEITESSLVDQMGAALGALARLRLKGFGLSIDDYGTGFSSMQQLARFPFTELKIDRSFVHGAHQRTNLRVILQSALDMARQLDLVSVAEGIETLEDWRLLQECGCRVGQGFLIARPMPASELPQWLRRHQGVLHELRRPELAPALPANLTTDRGE